MSVDRSVDHVFQPMRKFAHQNKNVRVQDARFEQLLVIYQNKVLEAAR